MPWLLAAAALLASPAAPAAELKPETLRVFESYVRGVDARQAGQDPFLWTDASPARRQRVHAGEVVCEPWGANAETKIAGGGLVHDWAGAVFIPAASVDQVLALVQSYNRHKDIYKPEVVDSRILSHQGNDFKVYLRLLKKKVITVVLNTEHDVRYIPVDATRWRSRSYTTKIAEVQDPGKKNERELPPGTGHGFLWRLDTWWRFEQRDRGVYVECEAISLTRDVPTGLGWLIDPIIRNLPKESLANTLRATRDAVTKR